MGGGGHCQGRSSPSRDSSPITLGVGLIGIVLTLPMMEAPFTMALEKMLERFQ